MERMTLWSRAACVLVGILAVAAACNARRTDESQPKTVGGLVSAVSHEDTVYRLDLRGPRGRQVLRGDSTEIAAAKFVVIDVTAVTNPAKLSLSLELRYQPERGEEALLGTVTLFPADNPGRFIIATGGVLRVSSALTLTLVSPDSGAGRAAVRVAVRTLTLQRQ